MMLRSLLASTLLFACALHAQVQEASFRLVSQTLDSGARNGNQAAGSIVFQDFVGASEAKWLRLHLDGTVLPPGSRLFLTSVPDGAVQWFDGESLRDYGHRSAYFNGNAVVIELQAGPGSHGNRVRVSTIEAGLDAEPVTDSICGTTDDRALSNDARQGRQYPTGCTSWLISESVVLTAGHCTANAAQQIHFNVPLSSSTGGLRFPLPEDQYPYDTTTLQRLDAGVGADWAAVRTVRNSNTGLFPGQRQGSWYALGAVPGAPSGNTIRITGYGTTASPVDPSYNQAQKTHTGPLSVVGPTNLGYATDTTGGNSGSPILHENTGMAVGIHTHGGCSSTGGYNQGTRIDRADLQAAIQTLLQGGTPTPPSAPTGLDAFGGSGNISLTWVDTANNESGFRLEQSTDGVTFSALATLATNATSYVHVNLQPGVTRYYRVRAENGAGPSAWSNTASATTLPAQDFFAGSDVPNHGTLLNGSTYVQTQAADGVAEEVREVIQGRTNSLQHGWTIGGVPATGTRVLNMKAWKTVSSDGDNFTVQVYNVSRARWVTAFTVTSTTAPGTTLSYTIPTGTSGTVRVQVIDSNSTKNATFLDTLFVDQLYVRAQ